MNSAHRKILYLPIVLFLSTLLISSCSLMRPLPTVSEWYKTSGYDIPIPEVTREKREKFNIHVKAEKKTIIKEDGTKVSGYVTDNTAFLEEVITPVIEPYLDDLSRTHPAETINTLALLVYELYRMHFGVDTYNGGFFRWGGDILDLDDPQEEGIRCKYRYGLDCSGYASAPYELAVYYRLFQPGDDEALFSSRGFELYCRKHNIQDKGGRGGTSNRYRVDSSEMAQLGREIVYIEQGTTPSEEDISKMQAGDLAGRSGHFGLIVEIKGELYYLESGGWVVPPRGGQPIPVKEALTIFAEGGPVIIRRCLPDYE